jgi:hypothetical protein
VRAADSADVHALWGSCAGALGNAASAATAAAADLTTD